MKAWLLQTPKLSFLALGAILALGHAPFGLWYIAFPSLVIAQVLWLSAPQIRRTMTVWWFGLGYFLVTMNWLVEPFLIDIKITGWMAPFALAAMSGGLAMLWAIPVRLRAQSPYMLSFSIAFAECLRGYILTGFPWGQIGYIWVETPVALWAAFIGSYGLSALTLIAALAIASVMFARRTMVLMALIGVLFLLPALFHRPQIEFGDKTVRIVQPNATQSQKWDPEYSMVFFQRALDYTGRAGDVDLVIWPESSVPVFLNYAEDLMAEIALFAQGKPVLVGALRFQEDAYYNSVVLVEQNGSYAAIYDKAHLVPFGEYLPFGAVFDWFGLSALADIVGGGFDTGAMSTVVAVEPVGSVLPLICYEAVFPQEVNAHADRADLMVQLTNDGWFGNFSGPSQHLAQTQMRAIEQGVPLVRAANTGISAVIDPLGRIVQKIPLNEQGFIDVPLPKPIAATLYTRWGERSVILLLCFLGFLCLITPKGTLGLTRHT